MPAPIEPVRILAVDVGTGTQDILLFESGKTIENCFKLVMPSPTVIIADRIKRATEHEQQSYSLALRWWWSRAIGQHAITLWPVICRVTPEAAQTFDDDLSMVAQMGFELIDEHEAAQRASNSHVVHIELQDFNAQAIITALQAFDVSPRVDARAIAAFDHGPLLQVSVTAVSASILSLEPFIKTPFPVPLPISRSRHRLN